MVKQLSPISRLFFCSICSNLSLSFVQIGIEWFHCTVRFFEKLRFRSIKALEFCDIEQVCEVLRHFA